MIFLFINPLLILPPHNIIYCGQAMITLAGLNDFFKEVEQNLYKVQYRVLLSRYRGRTICPECKGYRLRKEALYVEVSNQNIGSFV
ncbi:MAG: hypothetical protein WKF59_06100 [Chitinophagaceae bacterium]